MVTDGAEPLIDGEEWATTRQDDAAHWLSVCDQMLALHAHMLRQLSDAPADLVGDRRALIEDSLARLSGRRQYWHECCLRLADVVYDSPLHKLTIGDRSVVFTLREAQLLNCSFSAPITHSQAGSLSRKRGRTRTFPRSRSVPTWSESATS